MKTVKLEKFTEEHQDYRLITQFIRTTLPTLTDARFLIPITDKDQRGNYMLEFTGTMNNGLYQITLFVVTESPEKSVVVSSMHRLVFDD